MIDRRTFTTLLAGSVAAPQMAPHMAWGQGAKGKTVYFASVGGELTLYSMDVDGAALTKVNTTTLPANIQYAWPHPSRQYFYVVSSGGGPGVPRRSPSGYTPAKPRGWFFGFSTTTNFAARAARPAERSCSSAQS